MRPVCTATVNPDDKYTLRQGRIFFITGTQALVRLPMTQQQRERRAGRDTASACARPNGKKSSRGAARPLALASLPERIRGYGHAALARAGTAGPFDAGRLNAAADGTPALALDRREC